MQTKFIIPLCTALIPLIIGAFWYSPNFLGNASKAVGGLTPQTEEKGHAPWIYFMTYVFGIFISFFLSRVVIHQYGLLSMLANEPDLHIAGTQLNVAAQQLLDTYAYNFRSFKHGAMHGTMTGILLVLPTSAIIAMFEKRRWTYVAIHTGYWIVCLALMGGVLCAFLPTQILLAK